MKDIDIQNKVISATKWSSMIQITSRLVTPLTNMILARILAPEAFGVAATVTMIISFAEMFADSGFQKYLIQHDFENDNEKNIYANIAFWTNFIVALVFMGLIIIFRNYLASLTGNPGSGLVIAVATLQLPLSAFSSIQMALYKRDFDFKTLFFARIITTVIPFIVTIPLALLGFNFWSLVIGSIVLQLLNAIVLTIKSKWKPCLYYDLYIFRKMFSFSFWSLIEAISIWLTTWIDTFIIGKALSNYYLGIYKTSTSMVNTIILLFSGTITPVLFPTLSRLQNNQKEFENIYFKFQKVVGLVILPLGIGIYLYSDMATYILLGNKWSEASGIISNWALTSSIMIVFGYFCSEVYRAKGKPILSFFSQVLHLIVLIPTCIICSKLGFWPLVYARAWIRIQFVLVHFIIMQYFIGISIIKTIKNNIPSIISSLSMGVCGYLLKQLNNGLIWNIFSIYICIMFYLILLCFFPETRKIIIQLKNTIVKKFYSSEVYNEKSKTS